MVSLFDWIFSLPMILERDFDPVRLESLFLINSENSWQFLFSFFWVSTKTLYYLESLLFLIFSDPKILLNDGYRLFFFNYLNLWGDLEAGESSMILFLLVLIPSKKLTGDLSLFTD